MKKSVILFSVASAAYGATLLAIGIYILQYDLAELFVELLVDKLNFLGIVLSIALYLPIILMRFIPYIFIIYGAGYIIFFARTLYNVYKCDFQWLYKNLRILSVLHCGLFVLIAIADAVIISYIVHNIHSGVSVALTVFTALINLTAIVYEITDLLAVKKLKQNM